MLFKPTSKRFLALWQGTALRIFFVFSFFFFFNRLSFTISNVMQPTDNHYEKPTERKRKKKAQKEVLALPLKA